MRKIALLCVLMLAALAGRTSAQTTVGGTATMGVSAASAITVALAPSAATVATSSTQIFIVSLTSDMTNAGANLSLSCTGSCGTLSLSFVRTGASVTYTAPSTANTVVLTATSVQDPTRFDTSPITVTATTPPAVVNFVSTPLSQASASTNTYPIPPTIGNSVIVSMAVATADVLSSVQACNPSNVCTTLTQACPPAGPCFGTTTPGGSSYQYFGVNLSPGLTSIKVNNSSPSGNIDIGILDVSGLGGIDTASIISTQTTPTTTPTGPSLTPSTFGELLVSSISSTSTVTGLQSGSLYTFAAMNGGDGLAYLIESSASAFTPGYTQTSGTWSGFQGAYALGTTPSVVRVNVSPTPVNVQVNATQQFTATVTNDTANAGVDWTRTGANCSGATCGTLSASHTASGTTITYTAPASVPSPSPVVTLTAASTTDNTKSAAATITVGAAAIVGVTVSPTAQSTQAGGATVSITPTVANDPPNGGVTWTLTGPGSLSATNGPSGTPVTYTPPTTVSSTQTVTVTATSVDDNTKSASSTITVSQTGTSTKCGTPCPAFPTAQGAGAAALGGRGGIVIEVKNLNDTGPDSLRACTNDTHPRTCVFRVSGTIPLKSRLQITSPFLTIAGQTAPGSGIVLGGPGQSGEQIQISTHDVVIRYITWSGNAGCVVSTVGGTTYCDFSKTTGPAAGTVGLEVNNCGSPGTSTECKNIIFDHTTMRWAGNKGWLDLNNGHPSTNVTFQWGLGMEPNAAHPVITEPDSTCTGCTVIGHGPTDFHHNFVANYDHRWILFNIGSGIMQNNIGYNGQQLSDSFATSVWGGMFLDLIGNKFVDGPQSIYHQYTVIYQTNPNVTDPADCHGTSGNCDNTRQAKFYFLSNIAHPGNNTGSTPIALTTVPNDAGQKSLCQVVLHAEGTGGASPQGACDVASPGVFVSAPTQSRQFPITQENVANLDNVLLATVGNSQHLDCNGNFVNNRDSEANRVIQQYKNHTGGVPFAGLTSDPEGTSYAIRYNGLLDTSKKDAVWTTGTPTEPPTVAGTACTETLHDGIPDQWKTAHGLSTTDPNLYKAVSPVTGYTQLENYLNGLIP